MDRQMDARNSTDDTTEVPQSNLAQILIFNNIVEEKTGELRRAMTEFLKVLPYYKFQIEFSNFIEHLKHIAEKESCVGVNVVRQTKAPAESNANSNQLSMPKLQIRMPHKLCTNVMGFTETNIEAVKTVKSKSFQQPESAKRLLSSVSATQYTANSPLGLQRNGNDKTMKSPIKKVVLKTNVGLQNNCRKGSFQLVNQNHNTSTGNVKYIDTWSINMKKIQLRSKTSQFAIIITGILVSVNGVVLEKYHNAGILKARVEKNLVKTTNGLYHLNGIIKGGFPKNLYHIFLKTDGVPINWKSILEQISDPKKNNEMVLERSSFKSSAKAVKPRDLYVNIAKKNMYEKNENFVFQNFTLKNKHSELPENSLTEYWKFEAMMAAADRFPCTTPTNILKNKFHQKFLFQRYKTEDINKQIYM